MTRFATGRERPIRSFAADAAGNVAIIFCLALMVLMGGAGAAIDYVRLVEQKTAFTAAADAAVLAAISSAQQAEKNGATGIPKIAREAAAKAWAANVAGLRLKLKNEPEIKVSKSGLAWTATLKFEEDTPTTFMSLVGVTSMPMRGEARASTTIEKIVTYWDFHIVIDTSSSMGIGATKADMDAMQSHPQINCTFACHWADYTKGEEDSVLWAKKAGIRLRVDIVDDAVDAMVKDMQTASTADNVRAKLWGLHDTVVSLVDMTKKLNDIRNHKIELYRTPVSVGNTNYRVALGKLEDEVGKAGAGKSSVDPKKAVFIVTDGIHDAPVKESNFVVDWHDHYAGPIDPAFCKKMKDNGVTVGVLYIDYIVPPAFDWAIDPFKPQILPNLKACASEGLFYNASTPDGISKAMKDMLATAFGMGKVRLTE